MTAKEPNYRIGVYAMSKAALDNMVKWLAVELMAYSIRVNAIAPGLVVTEMTAPIWKYGGASLHESQKG